MRQYQRRRNIFYFCVECHGNVLGRKIVQLPALLGAAAGGAACYLRYKGYEFSPDFDLHTYTTLLVSLLLVFRTNASYEGYKASITAFNSMITTASNLGTQICAFVAMGEGDRCAVKQLLRLCVLMCITIKHHIKSEDLADQLLQDGMLTKNELEILRSTAKPPVAVAFWMRLRLADIAKHNNVHSPSLLLALDNSISEYLQHFQSVCFHKFVPVPFQYSQLMKLTLCAYVCVAPFAFCQIFEDYTPLAAYCLAVLVFAVEAIGAMIECPFGDDPAIDLDVESALDALLDDMDVWSRGIMSQLTSEESSFHRRRQLHSVEEDQSERRTKSDPSAGLFRARTIAPDWDLRCSALVEQSHTPGCQTKPLSEDSSVTSCGEISQFRFQRNSLRHSNEIWGRVKTTVSSISAVVHPRQHCQATPEENTTAAEQPFLNPDIPDVQ